MSQPPEGPYGQYGVPGSGGRPQFQPPHSLQAPGWSNATYRPTTVAYPGPASVAVPVPVRPQRPVVVAMAATMAVTASLQWICALSFFWLVATAGAASLSSSGRDEAALFHMLNRFHYRMVEGLAWPMYLFPTVAFFLGFLILAPRPWTRWALTLCGLAAVGWSAWWLRNDLIWWVAPALYIIVTCMILWTPGASQWYRWKDPRLR